MNNHPQTTDEAKIIAMTASTGSFRINSLKMDNENLNIEVKIGKLETKVDFVLAEIKNLRDGTYTDIATLKRDKLDLKDSYPYLYKEAVEKRLNDHDEQIRMNTNQITRIMTWGSAAIVFAGILEFIFNKFLK